MATHLTPDGDSVNVPSGVRYKDGVPEDIASQSMQGAMPPEDDPAAGEPDLSFIEAAEEVAPEGDRLERLNSLKTQLIEAQFEIGRIEALLETAITNERKLREEHIPNLMKEVQMKELTLEDGVKLKVEDDFRCGISEGHRPLAFKWLRENDLGGIIKRVVGVQFGKGDDELAATLKKTLEDEGYAVDDGESVHYQTLRAALGEEREKGVKAIPQDLFGLFEFQTTKLEFPRKMTKPPKPIFQKKPKK